MEDRELLVRAAKAAGIEGRFTQIDPADGRASFCGIGEWFPGIRLWNPLTDDGDALRLAVKLRIKVRYNEALGQALAWPMGAKEAEAITVNIENCGDDECEATRRAIVRAAATLGECAKPPSQN